MTVKEFFKSKVFQCILTLTLVLLASGILLSVCWGFLEITDAEREGRKFNVIYGSETVTPEAEKDFEKMEIENATIEKVWYIPEKNDYVVQAYSGGYNGTITCWVAIQVKPDNKKEIVGIRKVIKYAQQDDGELVGNIKSEIYEKFEGYTEGTVFNYGDKSDSSYIQTGASFSLTAICNCVNSAVTYVKTGGNFSDPYADFFTTSIDMNKTRWVVDGEEITYTVVTKANGGPDPFTIEIKVDATKTITSYTIQGRYGGCVENEHEDMTASDYWRAMAAEAKDMTGKTLSDVDGYLVSSSGVLVTGATRSNELCYRAAKFALQNYELCLTTPDKGGNAE